MPYPYHYTWKKKPERAGLIGPVPGKLKNQTFNGFYDTDDHVRVIEASLRRIFHTVPGDRVMLPEFGCNLRKFLFEPNDNFLVYEIKSTVKKAIERWEPRVQVINIDCRIIPDEHVLIIQLSYLIVHTGQSLNLKLDIY